MVPFSGVWIQPGCCCSFLSLGLALSCNLLSCSCDCALMAPLSLGQVLKLTRQVLHHQCRTLGMNQRSVLMKILKMIRNGDVMLMSWCRLGPMPFLWTEVWPTAICHICHGAISSRSFSDFSEVFPSWQTSIDPETCSFDPSKTKFPEAINLQKIVNVPGCTSFLCKSCQLCRKKTCRCLTRECSAQTQPTMWEPAGAQRQTAHLLYIRLGNICKFCSAVTDEGLWTSNESTIEFRRPRSRHRKMCVYVSLGFSNSGQPGHLYLEHLSGEASKLRTIRCKVRLQR